VQVAWTFRCTLDPIAILTTTRHFSKVAWTDQEDHLSRSAPVAVLERVAVSIRGLCGLRSGYFGFSAMLASPTAGLHCGEPIRPNLASLRKRSGDHYVFSLSPWPSVNRITLSPYKNYKILQLSKHASIEPRNLTLSFRTPSCLTPWFWEPPEYLAGRCSINSRGIPILPHFQGSLDCPTDPSPLSKRSSQRTPDSTLSMAST
jgi:hypothetical protein